MSGASEDCPVGPELLGQLLDQHGPALALYAAQWTDAADDCVQEALVELARQKSAPANLRAWLFRVVKHRALNAARGERRRREREGRAANRFATSDSAVSEGWNALDVTDALASLEPTERELVVMRIWGGLTLSEIATALESSTSNVQRQYQRALEKLRQKLESPCTTNMTNLNSRSRER